MALRLAGQDDNTTNNEQSVQSSTSLGADPRNVPDKNDIDMGININRPSDDPWEHEGTKRTRSISDTMDTSTSNVSDVVVSGNTAGDKNTIVTISGIVLYALFALAVAALAWMSVMESPVNIHDNIKKVQPLFSFLSIYVIIDAIIVFVLNEKRISLIVFAVVLQPFYPIKRNKVVNGSGGIGALVTLAYFIGLIALMGSLYKGFSTYGSIIVIEDPSVRRSAVAMLDQPMDNGVTYGQLINEYMIIDDAAIEEKNDQTLIALTGKGNVSLRDDGIYEVGTYNVDTALVFSKDLSGNYNIVSVQLGNKKLTGAGAQGYWNAIKTN